MTNNITASIEAILFATSEPQSFKSLAERLQTDTETIKTAVHDLQNTLEGHGIMVVISGESATLVTRPEESALIETIRKEELNRELSKASAETLAIVAYYPGATKAQIEFIRGVNASYSLRALMMRGLVEQTGSGRAISYQPTLEMLRHFGVQAIEELPNFTETNQKIIALLEKEAEEIKA